ncbi:MAG TPA: hypothetical protein VKN99_03090 [Polyangia bacterium]|nr:hypothetical protein [Polyangia bacterium]
MNEETRARLNALPDLIVDAVDAVDIALDEKGRERVRSAHEKLTAAVSTYSQVLASLDAAEKAQVEQRFGRRITDLKRQAARLPRGEAGRTAELARDAGSVPFIEQRAPGKSIQEVQGTARRRGEKPRHTVGGDIEAWCGPCGGLTTHSIVAMVGDEPAQVICQTCGAKHNYRVTPARKGGAPEATAAPSPRARSASPSREQLEAEKRERERMELRKELAAATNVRPFSPKERYKAGEIIDHPEHGRGKVETVTRGSLLVRFGHGLRPVDLS